MKMAEKQRTVYAGTLSFEGEYYDAFINGDREVLVKSRGEESGFKTIGTFGDYLNKVEDMFGVVSLWRVYADNFKK